MNGQKESRFKESLLQIRAILMAGKEREYRGSFWNEEDLAQDLLQIEEIVNDVLDYKEETW